MDLLNSDGGGDITHISYNSSYFIVVTKNQVFDIKNFECVYTNKLMSVETFRINS